jgi:hypothetical protein
MGKMRCKVRVFWLDMRADVRYLGRKTDCIHGNWMLLRGGVWETRCLK